MALVGLALGGCTAVYAPPVRVAQLGAPGRLQAGQVEISAANVGLPHGFVGSSVGYAAREHLIVQAGADGAFRGFAMGWAGVQVPGTYHLTGRWSVSADGELGAGAGAGGSCDEDDSTTELCRVDRPWYRRAAGGGYLGAGGALRYGPISLYSRARVQTTAARDIPMTTWTMLSGGLHGHILDRADVFAGVTGFRYANGVDAFGYFAAELGLAFRFDPILGWRR